MAVGSRTETHFEGLKEIEEALSELAKATGKNVVRRASKDALEPMADKARGGAREKSGKLKRGIKVGTKLNKRQKPTKEETRSYIEMYMGPSAGVVGLANEFGTFKMAAQPFMRPAWDQGKGPLLTRMKDSLWAEIKKAGERAARKQAKLIAQVKSGG